MASSSGSQYGNYNPSAVDPYPIESVLAPLAAPDSAQARSMLQLYQMQRQAGSNIYGEELDKQHDFNRQQLANQLKESYLKAGPDYLKEAGGAGLLASIPEYASTLGLSPEAVAQATGQSNQAHSMTNLKNLGGAVSDFSTAGMPIPEQSVQGMTGLPVKQGVRPDVQIGAGHDAARLAGARISAANKGPLSTLTTVMPMTGEGAQTTLVTNRLPGQSVEGTQAEHEAASNRVTGARSGTSTPTGQGAQLDTNSPVGKAAQTAAMKAMDQVSKQAAAGHADSKKIQADVDATRKGAAYTIVKKPSGVVGIQGKEGFYPLGNG